MNSVPNGGPDEEMLHDVAFEDELERLLTEALEADAEVEGAYRVSVDSTADFEVLMTEVEQSNPGDR